LLRQESWAGGQFTSDSIGVVRRQGNKKQVRAYLDDAPQLLLTAKISAVRHVAWSEISCRFITFRYRSRLLNQGC
jgi:hypothetical protein